MVKSTKQKRTNTNYELFILLLSVLSFVNLVIVILPFSEDVKGVVTIIDVSLCLIYLSDFLYRLASSSSKWGYIIGEWGWLDYVWSLPFPGMRIARLLRMWRVFRGLRQVGIRKLVPRLMIAGIGETRYAQQLIGDAGHRRDHDHGKHTLAVTYMVPDNASYAPDTFPTTDRCSSKF